MRSFIGDALSLNIANAIHHTPTPRSITLLLILIGLSSAFGQSLGLFLNHAPPKRYLLSLFLNGLVFVAGYLMRGIAITLVSQLSPSPVPLRQMIAVMLSALTPWLFGLFIFMPHLGSGIQYILIVWSYIIITLGITLMSDLPLWASMIIALSGWGMMAASRLIGKRLLRVIHHQFISPRRT